MAFELWVIAVQAARKHARTAFRYCLVLVLRSNLLRLSTYTHVFTVHHPNISSPTSQVKLKLIFISMLMLLRESSSISICNGVFWQVFVFWPLAAGSSEGAPFPGEGTSGPVIRTDPQQAVQCGVLLLGVHRLDPRSSEAIDMSGKMAALQGEAHFFEESMNPMKVKEYLSRPKVSEAAERFYAERSSRQAPHPAM